MMLRAIILTIAVAAAGGANAACTAGAQAAHPHLLELYTSEGCSSCPPAERWLRLVSQDAAVVALEFHVDYWDSHSWRDRFDSPRFTVRQHELAKRAGGRGIVYTPEVALDGHEWRDWYRHGPPTTSVSAPAQLRLDVQPGAPLRVQVDTHFADAEAADGYRNYVALIENGLSSQVRGGENRGKRLEHDAVVRTFVGPLPLVDDDVAVKVPDKVDLSQASLVAFAQRDRDGAIAQVVRLPLASCR